MDSLLPHARSARLRRSVRRSRLEDLHESRISRKGASSSNTCAREVEARAAEGHGTRKTSRKTVTLEKYKDWENYARLREWTVEAAYYNLKIYK